MTKRGAGVGVKNSDEQRDEKAAAGRKRRHF